MCIVYIEESFDINFNMGYGSGKSPMAERVNKKTYAGYYITKPTIQVQILLKLESPCQILLHYNLLRFSTTWNFLKIMQNLRTN